jgi:serine/alanine adding enzyme
MSERKWATNDILVSLLGDGQENQWDEYVVRHPEASIYHLSSWRTVVEKAYGLETYYLLARTAASVGMAEGSDQNGVIGILPLVHLRHFLFGNHLISMPFVDMGGVLADHEQAAEALQAEAMAIARRLEVEAVELRYSHPPAWLETSSPANRKVRMLVDLPDNSAQLWQSFRSKLKSQIRKPMKEGLQREIGGGELLNSFYEVFARNMRDLGSPVHSKRLLAEVFACFGDKARVIIVFTEKKPLAGAIVIGFGKMLANPWSSSDRAYSRLSPNMLLYWSMLEFGCDHGYSICDLGRSTPGQGTYRFKQQWGAREMPLHWQRLSLNGGEKGSRPELERFQAATQLWQRMPVALSIFLGPLVRKHIGL